MKKEFWVKMEFTDFCSHYLNMSQKEVFDDVRQSMADLMSGNSKGNSFGAKMVAKARERLAKLGPINTANGKNGGRPRALSGPMPQNKQVVYDFAKLNGIDVNDAYECWYTTTQERDGKDADGRPIKDWQPFLKGWCKTREKNRKRESA